MLNYPTTTFSEQVTTAVPHPIGTGYEPATPAAPTNVSEMGYEPVTPTVVGTVRVCETVHSPATSSNLILLNEVSPQRISEHSEGNSANMFDDFDDLWTEMINAAIANIVNNLKSVETSQVFLHQDFLTYFGVNSFLQYK